HHLEESYATLIRTNRRLIFLNEIAGHTSRYDSWDGANYGTTRPDTVLRKFESMQSSPPNCEDYIVLQMQATSTRIKKIAAASAITWSDASSPLLATKTAMDNGTNPWLRANAAQHFSPDYLLVLLNDFVDNCMVDTAIELTEARVARG